MHTELEEKVDRLEALLGEFIIHTKMAFTRLERSLDRMEEDRRQMNRQWGELANKMGTLVEDIVAPNIPRIAKEYFGCEDVEFFGIRVKKRNQKARAKKREFDVIAVCDDRVIINETKSTPRIDYINDFIEALKEFYDYFPEYKEKKIIPIFASLYISDDIVSFLTKNGIYAMGMKEDTMNLINFSEIGNK